MGQGWSDLLGAGLLEGAPAVYAQAAPTLTPTAERLADLPVRLFYFFPLTGGAVPSPTPTPEPPPWPPESAQLEGISGVNQSLPLSCESSSAVDWAAWYGAEIAELDFQYNLPFTDDPETGYVGNPRGVQGTPPGNYGVHAPPVAALLRAYGVRAEAQRGYSLGELRGQIASGNPVIVWVIGAVQENGKAVTYYPASGEERIVAFGEHTVMAVGYSPNTIDILDGGKHYDVSLERFLNSWSVLQNQAVIRGE